MRIDTYLMFDDQCREAFTFYQQLLGGEVSFLTMADTPMADRAPEGKRDAVAHARLDTGAWLLMGSDNCSSDPYRPMQGFSVSLGLDDPKEAERVFAALSEGGTTSMAIQETFWSVRFGMCTDRFGTPWMVNGPAK